jgi:hypothetical protein
MTTTTQAARDEAIAELRELLPIGSEVYTVLEHRTGTGTTRWLKVYTVRNGGIRHISHTVSLVTGYPRTAGRDGVKIGGTGMDMGWDLVHTLGVYLHGDGYALTHRWL